MRRRGEGVHHGVVADRGLTEPLDDGQTGAHSGGKDGTATGSSRVALAISRNHMPNSGPLVPPVFKNPLDTASKTSAKLEG